MNQFRVKSMRIITNYINIERMDVPQGNYDIKPIIKRSYGKVNEVENNYVVELEVQLKNSEKNQFPIDLSVRMVGLFEIEGDDINEINNFLKVQGVQMVFPHLRALISSITAASLMPVINLPLINPNQFLDIESKEFPIKNLLTGKIVKE